MSYKDDGWGNQIWVDDAPVAITSQDGNWTTADNGTTWQPVAGKIDPASISESAAQTDPRGTMADVVRSMSDDFFKTAIPVKDDLIKMTTYNGNSGVVDALKSQGMAAVNQSFDNAQGQANRNTQRYGMALTKEQSDAQASALSSGKALAQVDTTNRAVQSQRDLNKQLVSGMGSPAGITK